MPHRRSPASFIKRLVKLEAFRDQELDETICLSTQTALLTKASQVYGEIHKDKLQGLNFERGEILIDGFGRGTLQRVPPPKIPRMEVNRKYYLSTQQASQPF